MGFFRYVKAVRCVAIIRALPLSVRCDYRCVAISGVLIVSADLGGDLFDG